ncbi:Dual-specificity RNA methyltransferase RlmN [Candidatus Hepatincola sp. Pdp]
MENLLNLTFEELQTKIIALPAKPFRAKQIWHFLYNKGAASFAAMPSLGKELQAKLAENYNIARPKVIAQQQSADNTIKYLLALADGKEIEAVYIPSSERGTICISTQVGCNMGCTFCNTGTQPMVRNLTCGEILGQVMLIKDLLKDYNHLVGENRQITNIVFMGMGEPLQNYKEVKKSIAIFNNPEGLAISRRKITLSTCGIVPKIKELAQDIPVNLSISLHAPTDALRNSLMPINSRFSINEVLEAAKNYYETSNTKRITLVYIMIKNINDTLEHAKELLALAKRLPCKINLIPFHAWQGSSFASTADQDIRNFGQYLINAGFTVNVRTTRGDDILAACGQLKSNSLRVPKQQNMSKS